MTLSARIRALLKAGFTPKEIAEKLGCADTYVRAVRNRVRNKQHHGMQQYPAEYASARAIRRTKEYREWNRLRMREYRALKRAA